MQYRAFKNVMVRLQKITDTCRMVAFIMDFVIYKKNRMLKKSDIRELKKIP